MNQSILYLLACPLCKGDLRWAPSSQELICRLDKLAYPVIDGIPMMLVNRARTLEADD